MADEQAAWSFGAAELQKADGIVHEDRRAKHGETGIR
jgi:hypothetical protein